MEVKTLFIEPGSPWENGYIESFNGKPGMSSLTGRSSTTLIEARVLIADWRKEYNQVRPHSARVTSHRLLKLSWYRL
jgi:transposase InsO family protein